MHPGSHFDALRTAGAQLRIDRATLDQPDTERQAQLCQVMWWMRHLALLAGMVAYPEQAAAIAAAAVVSLTVNATSRQHVEAGARLAIADAVLAVVLASGVTPLVLPSSLMLVLVISGLGWAATFRPFPALTTFGLLASALVLSVLRGDVPEAATWLVGFCALGGILTIRAIRLNIAGRSVAARHIRIDETVDAILWEEIPSVDGAMRVSAAAERVLGYPAERWAEPDFWRRITHPEDLAASEAEIAMEVRAMRDHAATMRMVDVDGVWHWMENRISSVKDRSGNHLAFVGVLLDRTETKEAEAEALQFGEMVKSSPIGQMLVTLGPAGVQVVASNDTAAEILGSTIDWSAEGTLAGEIAALVSRVAEMVAAATEASGCVRDAIATLDEATDRHGRIHQVTARCVDHRVISVDLLDVTDRVDAAHRLEEQANRDALTGLPNRRNFNDCLGSTVESADGSPTSLLLLDLDEFKEINDALGHETGDEVLRIVARRMGTVLREGDHVARLGGDEFGIVLSGTDHDEAVEIARRVLEEVRRPLVDGDLDLRVDASIGIAVAPHDADDASALARHADVAMYVAKAAGGGWSRYDRRLDRSSADRLALVAELERAMEQNELILHHQPLVAGADGRAIGVEVLVRWDHPTRGRIPPSDFIELAEISGQIDDLTRWVVHRALHEVPECDADGMPLLVSVNFSARNLADRTLVDWLLRALRSSGRAPQTLVVEITESTTMDEFEHAVAVLEELRSHGIQVWIDDFGTGHSSLSRLVELPVDGVKIDRAFITAGDDGPEGRVVLEHLLAMIASLGLTSIAEGIETARQAALLEEMGCDVVQGFHLAVPASIDEIKRQFRLATPACIDLTLGA